jgi:hypothetical protein
LGTTAVCFLKKKKEKECETPWKPKTADTTNNKQKNAKKLLVKNIRLRF